jgi:hypothetical protein
LASVLGGTATETLMRAMHVRHEVQSTMPQPSCLRVHIIEMETGAPAGTTGVAVETEQ